MSELTVALQEALDDAERRFGDGPAPAWEAPSSLGSTARRRLVIAACAALVAMALLVTLAMARSRSAPDESVASLQADIDVPADATSEDEEIVLPGPLRTVSRPEASLPSLELERHGVEWRLTARGVTRADVARRLAEASGSALHGDTDALALSAPADLRWQGRSLSQAWPQVLGPDLSYALQCRRDRCEVWIAGSIRPASVQVHAGSAPMHSAAWANLDVRTSTDANDANESDDEAGR